MSNAPDLECYRRPRLRKQRLPSTCPKKRELPNGDVIDGGLLRHPPYSQRSPGSDLGGTTLPRHDGRGHPDRGQPLPTFLLLTTFL